MNGTTLQGQKTPSEGQSMGHQTKAVVKVYTLARARDWGVTSTTTGHTFCHTTNTFYLEFLIFSSQHDQDHSYTGGLLSQTLRGANSWLFPSLPPRSVIFPLFMSNVLLVFLCIGDEIVLTGWQSWCALVQYQFLAAAVALDDNGRTIICSISFSLAVELLKISFDKHLAVTYWRMSETAVKPVIFCYFVEWIFIWISMCWLWFIFYICTSQLYYDIEFLKGLAMVEGAALLINIIRSHSHYTLPLFRYFKNVFLL